MANFKDLTTGTKVKIRTGNWGGLTTKNTGTVHLAPSSQYSTFVIRRDDSGELVLGCSPDFWNVVASEISERHYGAIRDVKSYAPVGRLAKTRAYRCIGQITTLAKKGLGVRRIAKRLGLSKSAVHRAILANKAAA